MSAISNSVHALFDKLHLTSFASSQIHPQNAHGESPSTDDVLSRDGDSSTLDLSSPSDSGSSDASPSVEASVTEFVLPEAEEHEHTFVETDLVSDGKEGVADLVAEYGSSSATAWLEHDRYKVWRPTVPIPESSFVPVQGYLRADPFIFAWGNPLVSDSAALAPTCAAFIQWAKEQKLKVVWLCVDGDMEKVLGAPGSQFNWSTLSCIVEDVLEPKAVVDLATGPGGGSEVKDLKKNLRRAEREGVTVRELEHHEWTDEMKHQVEQGIIEWKKSRHGIQIASTSFQPWLDFEHRRYWVAEKDKAIVGLIILAPIHPTQYQIKNAVSFPNAPRGTSEELIFRAMQDLQNAEEAEDSLRSPGAGGAFVPTHSRSPSVTRDGSVSPHGHHHGRVTVTFGVSASDSLTPVDNLSGWKITWLSKTYNTVIGGTGLTRRHDFRNKFHSDHKTMYVCYPSEDGFGLDGVNKLIKCLRQ
ncbi:hypothetical protein BV25DRAFT_1800874 [Artomyces pyxidatus]|uniref:Uncharacterized protein n=1 Tax=Artomyces pyxidatus TaxID=48021 RepID=A0ACB8T6D6_9AGAM|nr:hypothetical protein BV25DRAFT_1800874 [Artomyces pyxidatus]